MCPLSAVRPAVRRTRPWLVTTALTTLVAACGGGGGSEGTESPTAVLSSGATSAPTAGSPLAQTPSSTAGGTPASGASSTGSASAPARSGKPTAASCAPTMQFPTGTVVTVRMRAADGSELTSRTTSLGPVARGGAQPVAFQTVALGAPEGTTFSTYRSISAGEVYVHGNTATERVAGGISTVDITMSPAVPLGVAIGLGESVNLGTLTMNISGTAADGAIRIATATALATLKFVGLETITVPAGTFVDTCRIDSTLVTDGQTILDSTWLMKDTGIVVRTRGTTGQNQLVGAAIGDRLIAGTLTGATTPAPSPGTSGAKR
jgi:hypothetical protein